MAHSLRGPLCLGRTLAVPPFLCRPKPVLFGNFRAESTPRQWLTIECAKSAKGFGKKKTATKKATTAKPTSKPTTKSQPEPQPQSRRVMRPPSAPNPSPDTNRPEPSISLPSYVPELDLLDPVAVDDKDFAARLSVLKEAGKLKKKEKEALAANGGQASIGNVLDAEPSIYANPPPITETILQQLNPGISDPSLQTQTFGPSQIGVAAGAIVLVGVLVATSVGGFSSSSRYKGVRPSKPPPNEIQAEILSNQIEQNKQALQANPKDEAALEALGYAYSDLYQFPEASDVFEQLVTLPSKKNDPAAWKLFGESSLLAERPGKAVQGFERAWALQGNDFNVLTNLTNAYIANGNFQGAVSSLKGVQQRLKVAQTAPSVTASAEALESTPDAPSTASDTANVAAPTAFAATTATTQEPTPAETATATTAATTTAPPTPAAAAATATETATDRSATLQPTTDVAAADNGSSATQAATDASNTTDSAGPASAEATTGTTEATTDTTSATYATPTAAATVSATVPTAAATVAAADTSSVASSSSTAAADSAVAGGVSLEDAADVEDAIATTSRDASSLPEEGTAGSLSQAASDQAAGVPSATSAPALGEAAPGTGEPQPVKSQLRALMSKKAKRLDPVGVDLLLGKVYSAWRGHDTDATATYDALIKEYPEDFRGYLAKGVFLRERGKGVEAKKMFLQARYYTPAGQQSLIDRIQKNEDMKSGPR